MARSEVRTYIEAIILPPRSYNSGDCTTALSEWSDLRCETLMSDSAMGEQRAAEAVLWPDPRAWEQLLGTLAGDGNGEAGTAYFPFPEKLRLTRLKLAALRDAVLPFPSSLGETNLATFGSRKTRRVPWEISSAWSIHSQEGCHLEEVSKRHS